MNAPPTFAVVVEWENALKDDVTSAEETLRRLREQIVELRLPDEPPVRIVYDPQRIGAAEIERHVRNAAGGGPWTVNLVAVPGARYFEQKNAGASGCTTDLIVFLDSDVIPEDGWLRGLLEAFADPRVEIAGGQAFIDPSRGLLEKAFALFWFFPLRERRGDLVAARGFWANNVAFRTAVFAAHPFPDAPTFRGQGPRLAAELVDHRRGLFRQHRSAVRHPAPRGRSFVAHALCMGHDAALVDRASGAGGGLASARRALGRAASSTWRGVARIARAGDLVGLGPIGRAAAASLPIAYYALTLLGHWITLVRPGWVPRRFRV